MNPHQSYIRRNFMTLLLNSNQYMIKKGGDKYEKNGSVVAFKVISIQSS